ncbi:Enoyl-CoA hydratase/isomerase [Sphingobium chlorophenolicum L-1]|uniref:Enoyl-CoA hydratase/isomerase n=1 Tax=Sphingobium chlorophenolicum L-1 TaxID=690566 RepID=F6EUH6_SPHCR|nr:enoyl-CoA hydratase/isomerase family protein [Sphingobium chlorophenolicum]AEG47870.1 Enoyl-CoA hydratase/isomerase [Sphingobium chlorophenolicum L-1]
MKDRKYLLTSIEDGVGIIQLNHPEKKNALGWELHEGIVDVLREWEDDDAVSCILFIGNEEYFCAGWRLDILNTADSNDRRRFNDLALALMRAIYDFGKPSVAAVAGVAPGYGMDVANMCDITIASENAAFGSTQIKYAMNGFYHGLMSRVGKQHARRMYYTGDPISAEEALRIGLVSEVVPVGSLRDTALKLAKQIAEMGPELAKMFKGVALRASNMDHLGALQFELTVTHDLLQRGIFMERVSRGFDRMKAGDSAAIERLKS